jgi:RNA polymerase sigma factor (sigma-70 family)
MTPPPDTIKQTHQLAAHLFRHSAGKMTAVLTRQFGLQHLDVVMDAVQDSFEMALTKWRYGNLPQNPEAWLMTVARNKLINRLKKDARYSDAPEDREQIAVDTAYDNIIVSDKTIADSQLQLLVTCCYPGFSFKNQLSITLYILCGFGVPEIANALLTNKETIKKAITRCKALLQQPDHIYLQQTRYTLEQNIHTVQTVLYLMFNEGYKTTRTHTGINRELCFEALRLTQILLQHPVAIPQTHALLALMFFNLSRFPARIADSGEWLTLEQQERSQWLQPLIQEGFYHLEQATHTGEVSKYHIEALITSIHCSTPYFPGTPWQKIVDLYTQLEMIEPPSPLLTLNKLIAQAYADIRLVDMDALHQLEPLLTPDNRFLYYAAKAHIYRRMGQLTEAITNYRLALNLASSDIDKQFIQTQLTACSNRYS